MEKDKYTLILNKINQTNVIFDFEKKLEDLEFCFLYFNEKKPKDEKVDFNFFFSAAIVWTTTSNQDTKVCFVKFLFS